MDHQSASRPLDDITFRPPGTVELLAEHGGSKNGELVLNPTPSDDPNDPLGWALWRKFLNFGLLAAMTVAIFTALGTQPVFWTQMVEELGVSYSDLTNAQASQLVGLAIGCVVFIPFAKKFGRRPIYIISTALVTAAAWWSSRMKTTTEIYLANILMGIAGATNETAIQMSIRDMFFIHQRGTANGIYLAAVTAGSFLTPMAAGAQALSSGWRSSYTALAAFMTGLTFCFILAFEETKFVPVIRGSRSSVQAPYELGPKITPIDSEMPIRDDGRLSTRPPFPRYMRLQLITRTNESLWRTFYYPIHTVWFPHVVLTSFEFASGICWFVIMAAITSIVFSKAPYHFNPAQVGYMFGGQCIGSVLGSLYGGYFVDKAIVWFAKRNKGIFEPEMRLYLMPFPALAMSAGLAVFGITADRGMHWIFPSIGGALFAFGFGAISDITFTLVIDSYPNLVAQTFVVVAFFRNAISIAGPFSITPWLERMSVSAVFIIAAGLSLGIHCIALPIAIWGKKARTAIAPRYYRLSAEAT